MCARVVNSTLPGTQMVLQRRTEAPAKRTSVDDVDDVNEFQASREEEYREEEYRERELVGSFCSSLLRHW